MERTRKKGIIIPMSNTVFLIGICVLSEMLSNKDMPGMAIASLIAIGIIADVISFLFKGVDK